MENLNVHGYSVNFDDAAREGVHYLINLEYEKAKDIFDRAVENGSVSFNYEGGGCKLVSNGGGIYTMSKTY